MSLARFIAAQRTEYRIPHATSCRALGVSPAWFYKWHRRDGPSGRERRRLGLAEAVVEVFGQRGGADGSPRIAERLRRAGWRVSDNTVAAIMREKGLSARPGRKRKSSTRPGRGCWRAEDRLRRDFSAPAPNVRWCGDGTEVPTGEGPLYLAGVHDLFSRRVVGFAMGGRKGAALATAALQMAVAVRGGDVAGLTFHSDQGSEYTAQAFRAACARLGIAQSMGRVGSALDNAASESWFSSLEFELLRRAPFATHARARAAIAAWIDDFNTARLHTANRLRPPIEFEGLELGAQRQIQAQIKHDKETKRARRAAARQNRNDHKEAA